MLPKIAEFFQGKRVLILGFGKEGISTYHFIRDMLPGQPLTIADRRDLTVNDKNVTLFCGERYLDCINNFDIVVKSPGISLKNTEIQANTLVTCQTELFLKYAPCKTIGVTGSKGKTTTSTLIYEMLRAAGRDARLIGNIGVPVLEDLKSVTADTIAVIEMSSHQLEFTRVSPEVAVLTNIYEEHLDHYKGGFAGYVQAKLNIVRYQSESDTFIYNATQGTAHFLDLNTVRSKRMGVCADDALPFALHNAHLLGRHNRQDVLFALCAARVFGVTDEQAQAAAENFSGIENRMENIGTYRGITFYNDCIATIPQAVECAAEALKTVDTLIFGGMDRGLDYTEFVSYLKSSRICNLIGMPETGHSICMMLGTDTGKNIYKAQDLEDAVRYAYAHTKKDAICLLSPAASSYNVYKNFEEKGKHYKGLVIKYATEIENA